MELTDRGPTRRSSGTATMTSGHGKWVGLVIGTVLIVLCLMVVLIKPVIDARVFWIIRVVLALAAGLVASGLTGFIVFEHKLPGLTIRAGGPMAVIVLVLLLDPGEAAAVAAQRPGFDLHHPL